MTEDPTRPTGNLAASTTGEGGVQYMFMTVKAIRGRERATTVKWESQGWELVDQTQGTLRSELRFRKVKPKGIGAYLAQGYAAFRGLNPKTQKTVLAAVGTVVGLLIIGIVVAVVAGGGDPSESSKPAAAGKEAPATPEPTSVPTKEPSTSASPAYSYRGPAYEVVAVDDNQGPAELTQYWIHTTAQFDLSSDAYKDQVKSILADVAHEHGSAEFKAEVVTNKEIAEAESPSTYEAFIAEHGVDYATKTIPKREVTGWVASYTGGLDADLGEASDDPSAYEIIWRPYATTEIEKWKP